MAFMKFREPNHVLWRGVRPAHDGEQVYVDKAIVDGTAVLYTVAAGKIFYLCSWTASGYFVAPGGHGILSVYDAVPAEDFRITILRTALTFGHQLSGNFWPPLEVPATYSIRIFASNANVTMYGSIHGWVE